MIEIPDTGFEQAWQSAEIKCKRLQVDIKKLSFLLADAKNIFKFIQEEETAIHKSPEFVNWDIRRIIAQIDMTLEKMGMVCK